MLSLTYKPAALRIADNLLPQHDGSMATRPGAYQVVSGDIKAAQPWGNRLLFKRDGYLHLWDQGETQIAPAGKSLDVAVYQALTQDALREDRLYVADGTNALWHIARAASGAYVQRQIANTVQDAGGLPYPIPVAESVATWRNRLWVAAGTNRAQHSQNKQPDAWDPLWTVEFQGERASRVRALGAHGDGARSMLIAGTEDDLWSVTGDSQYNWVPDMLVKGRGATAPQALASDGQRVFHNARSGLFELGVAQALSADLLDLLYQTPDYSAQLVLSPDGKHLLLLLHSRLFAMHTGTRKFGEILAPALGLLRTDDSIGWYGPEGIWLLGGLDTPDIALDGTQTPVESVYENWEDFPNLTGRALCNRVDFLVKGSDRAAADYTCTAAGEGASNSFTTSFTASDGEAVFAGTWQGAVRKWPSSPVRRTVEPRLAGERFIHRLSSKAHLEVLAMKPNYVFGEAD